jgi:hypothetical protein
VAAHAHDQDDVQCAVGVAVATAVEAVADRFVAGSFQWADPAEFGEGGVAADPVGVVADRGQQRGGGVAATTDGVIASAGWESTAPDKQCQQLVDDVTHALQGLANLIDSTAS